MSKEQEAIRIVLQDQRESKGDTALVKQARRLADASPGLAQAVLAGHFSMREASGYARDARKNGWELPGEGFWGDAGMVAANHEGRLSVEDGIKYADRAARHKPKAVQEREPIRKADYRRDPEKCRELVEEMGSVTAAAEAVGVTRPTFYGWLGT